MRLQNRKKRDISMNSPEKPRIADVQVNAPGVFRDANGQQILLTSFYCAGKIDLKGRRAALVIIRLSAAWLIDAHGLAVAPDFRAVLHAVEIHKHIAPAPL